MSMLASLGQFGLALGQGFQQKQEELKKEAERKAEQERLYRRQDVADQQAAESHALSMQTNQQNLEQGKATFEHNQQVNKLKLDADMRREALRKGLGSVMAARRAGDMDGAFGGLAALTEQIAQTRIDFDRDPATGKILLDQNGRAKAFALDANGNRTGNGETLSVEDAIRNVYLLADPVADQERAIAAEQEDAKRAAEFQNDKWKLQYQGDTQIKVAEIGAGSRLDAAALGAGSRVEVAGINANKGQSGGSRSGGGKDTGRRSLNYKGPTFMPPPNQFIPFINSASSQHGIEPALIMAMMDTESSHNPNATSPVGAAGLMQLMPNTAKGLGVPANKIYDPQTNILYGTQYYRQLLNQFKDPALALAAYNAGPNRVDAAIKANKAKGLPTDVGSLNLPSKTRDYVQRVISRYQQASAAYGNSPTGNPALDVQVENANVIAQNVVPVHDKWSKALGVSSKDGDDTALTAVQIKTRAALLSSMQNASVALTRMAQAKDAQLKMTYYLKAHAALAEVLQQDIGLRKIAAEQMAHQIVSEMAGHDSLTDLATWQRLGDHVAPNPNVEPPTSKAKPPAKGKTATNPTARQAPVNGNAPPALVSPQTVGNFRKGPVPQVSNPNNVDPEKIKQGDM